MNDTNPYGLAGNDFEDDAFGEIVCRNNTVVSGCEYGITLGNPTPDHLCAPVLERPKLFVQCQHCGRFMEASSG